VAFDDDAPEHVHANHIETAWANANERVTARLITETG
jgi:hypothetical protein